MAKKLAVLLASIVFVGCGSMESKDAGSSSRTPDHSENVVSGNDARYFLDIFKSAKSLDVSEGSCAPGTCYSSGAVSIICKLPSGQAQSCEITALTNPSVVARVVGEEADRLTSKLDKYNLVAEAQDSCSMGSCHVEAKFSMICRHPTEGDNVFCDVTPKK